MTIKSFGKLCRKALPKGYWIAWRETDGGDSSVLFGTVRTRYRGYKLTAPFAITEATLAHAENYTTQAQLIVNSALSKLRDDMQTIEGPQ